MNTGKLLDRNELLNHFPALRGRGKNPKWRLDWLLRKRAIPFVKVGTRSFYFDEDQIREWIRKNTVPVQNVDRNER